MKRKLGIMALAASSLFGLSTVAMARDHDRDDRYRGYYGMSEHERHEYQERMEKQAKKDRKRWEREQREAARHGYYNAPYGYRNNGYYNNPYRNNGYYDRYGYWHPYR